VTIRERRLEKGMTQKQLAQATGTNEMIISLLESEQVLPTRKLAIKIAMALDYISPIDEMRNAVNALKDQPEALHGKYHLHGRLYERPDHSLFKRAGYRSMNAWVNTQYFNLKVIDAYLRKEKTA